MRWRLIQVGIPREHTFTHTVMANSRKRPLEKTEDQPKRKRSRKHRPGFDDEIFSETKYFFRNGLRCVEPYYFSFTSHVKGRWVGSTVYDVFCREFQAEKPEYYEKAIEAGKVTVNSEVVAKERVLKHNELLAHRVHRHEPPVSDLPLTILHQDDNIVAINKPHSIPVHPCGRYRHNSVVFILGKEHNLKKLHTIHRLDRLTSGLLLFARNLATTQQLELQIRTRLVSKQYVCKCHGKFTEDSVVCTEPILIVTHKLGICRVDSTGKPCETKFTRISYNVTDNTSILKCEPKTGRMHQIRVHLQWLGHPIVNDPLYCHPAWGPEGGRGGSTVRDIDQVIGDIVKSNFSSEYCAETIPIDTPPETAISSDKETELEVKGREEKEEEEERGGEKVTGPVHDPDCTECRLVHPDPTPDQLIMYLHALRYTGPDWDYSTDMPSWATNTEHHSTI